MEEKKVNKISLSTFFLILAIIVIAVMSYMLYITSNEKNKKDEEIAGLNNEVSTLQSSVDNLQKKINTISDTINTDTTADSSEAKIKLGTYNIQIDKSIIDEDSYIGANDENIEFSDDNKFEAYIGEGAIIAGKYSISDNIVNCTIETFESEYTPEQKVTGRISFKIVDDSTIEIASVSETIKIETGTLDENGKWVLSGEYKDLYLSPFVEGIKFVLSK